RGVQGNRMERPIAPASRLALSASLRRLVQNSEPRELSFAAAPLGASFSRIASLFSLFEAEGTPRTRCQGQRQKQVHGVRLSPEVRAQHPSRFFMSLHDARQEIHRALIPVLIGASA